MKNSIILFTCVLLFSCQSSEVKENKKEKQALKKEKREKKSFIQQPFKHLNVEFVEYTYLPNEERILEYSSGTKIKMPKNAFVDEKGNVITEPVKIKYREFHDPIDIMASGIPMTIQQDGKEFTFMSAGMCEFRATSGDKSVQINPENPINIEMSSRQRGNDYNLYYFDEKIGKWQEKGKDSTTDNVEKMGGPAKPKLIDNSVEIVEVSEGDKEELRPYFGWVFQPDIKGKVNKIGGYLKDMDIKKINNEKYEITFIEHNGTKTVVKSHRVYSPGEGYNLALLKYQKEIYQFFKEKQSQSPVIRSFAITETGILNCDSPILNEPDFKEYKFTIEVKDIIACWALDKTINASFTFSGNSVKLNMTHDNLIIMQSKDNKIYHIPSDKISKWEIGKSNYAALTDVSGMDIYKLKHKLE